LRRIVHAAFSAEDRAFKYCEMLNAEDGECLCGGEAADFSAYVYKECSVPPPRQGADGRRARGGVAYM
jgi:hypothetical protein